MGRIEEEEVEIENLEKADLNVFMIQDGEVGQGGEDLGGDHLRNFLLELVLDHSILTIQFNPST